MSATVVSAPGKVLLAGGYLVLDPAYSGVVVSTSSRFYTVITPGGLPGQIIVRSPQFLDATWLYDVLLVQKETVSVVQSAKSPSASKNKFVELALKHTLALVLDLRSPAEIEAALSSGLDITIVGDNDFYSQQEQLKIRNLEPTLASLSLLSPFLPTNVRLSDVSKTGLGSSAALITSLISALLVHLDVIPPSILSGSNEAAIGAKRLAHNLAQFVHCLAQGKVGSGFDVAAAVFGSQLYTRFDPGVIQGLMNDDTTSQLFPTISPQNPAWDYRVEPFRLPPFTRILLADVHAGSNTPLLVGQVLEWRRNNSTAAHSVWTALDQLNTSLAQTLARLSMLHEQDSEAYLGTVKYISSMQSVQWTAVANAQPHLTSCLEAFYEAHLLTEQIRVKMREMGTLSGVEIEPAQQTKLLDDSVSLAGVIGGGVPGAGGYDAIWLLVCNPPEMFGMRPLQRVEHLWSSNPSVSPLLAEESTGSGVRAEDMNAVPGLREVIGK
ncbi:hypothetical protein HETIRDRAFT_459322 [Heterobasidion irregulare TC 32-1]|uniref:Phosphomevalonate kinase n=1 Tax=Heterobasidion irregulare (strain TC 32-1) TaxID=747525 RepID=W4K3Y3_HETIT|nr:uncharacterized protein HETIRDRAFT_459322 [Heterobasidion irregulare TC 32-1]ETW80543.1 hypothetical protein HETIRDRAFT_459322 [Heterobasidion irregulare TC 32-1]